MVSSSVLGALKEGSTKFPSVDEEEVVDETPMGGEKSKEGVRPPLVEEDGGGCWTYERFFREGGNDKEEEVEKRDP